MNIDDITLTSANERMDQITETSPGSSESILALSVGAAVDRAGADGGVCVLSRSGILDSIRLDALFSHVLIILPHTVEQGQKDGKGQRFTTTE